MGNLSKGIRDEGQVEDRAESIGDLLSLMGELSTSIAQDRWREGRSASGYLTSSDITSLTKNLAGCKCEPSVSDLFEKIRSPVSLEYCRKGYTLSGGIGSESFAIGYLTGIAESEGFTAEEIYDALGLSESERQRYAG